MDVVVKGRGEKVSERARELVHRKLARLSRHEPRVERVEVELIAETRRRSGPAHRVEAACRTPRRTFRAAGEGPDVDAALDQVVERLDRQLTDHHRKRRARLIFGALRAKFGAIGTRRPSP